MTEETHTQPLDPKERKKLYKKSLNLPKTAFPMKANLAQNEPQSRKRWEKADLYRQVIAAREGAEEFVFHDGPPYANGNIHVGHLLNKVLKDMVVRSRSLMGYSCPYIPGWDCHGLPIEHKVMTGLVESGKIEKLKTLEEDQRRMAIRRECQRYAEKFHKIQTEQMKRLLTMAGYDQPYLTMRPEYEKATTEVFAKMVEHGIVYRALKPVHWSIANETALAEAELEYMDRTDPSVYVHFDAEDRQAVATAFDVELSEDPSFLIWTTTPWTLPANLLIAVHREFTYVLAKIDGRPTVVAKELLEKIGGFNDSEVDILGEAAGSQLLGLTYRHPFVERSGSVVEADYVTLEDGTGLVHTAPGHGTDDYLTGMREGTEIYSPVRGDGTYDDSVPEDLRGLSVWDANPKIVERLKNSGHLLAVFDYEHSYPHDWRSKTPVIFRGTEQWFVAVDHPVGDSPSLREMALKASSDEIQFVPGWGVKRLSGMLESRPDWCISRQRSWGLPIPAFRTADGTVLLTPASVQAVADAFGREGSDVWFSKSPAEILGDYNPAADPDAPDGIQIEQLDKMRDIFDVWFESGSSWNSVIRGRGHRYPTDLYLEGSDQHRGWFQLSLLCGLGATTQAPFKTLLTHGFMVDKDGRKMSKSGGNALDVDDLLKDFGADVCRWWVSSLAFENDIKVDLTFFELAGESYRKVRNTLRFLLSNLADFDAETMKVPFEQIPTQSLDALALQSLSELRTKVLGAYQRYEFRQAHLALFDYCNDTLSSLYLDAVKDRLYCDLADSERRRITQTVLWQTAEMLSALLAPILPHTADETFAALYQGGASESVHLATAPDLTYTADADWPKVLEIRETVSKALENAKANGIDNPLDAAVTIDSADGLLDRFAADLPDVFGVSRVQLKTDGSELEVIDLQNEPRCERSWRRDETVAERSDGGWLSERDAVAVGLA